MGRLYALPLRFPRRLRSLNVLICRCDLLASADQRLAGRDNSPTKTKATRSNRVQEGGGGYTEYTEYGPLHPPARPFDLSCCCTRWAGANECDEEKNGRKEDTAGGMSGQHYSHYSHHSHRPIRETLRRVQNQCGRKRVSMFVDAPRQLLIARSTRYLHSSRHPLTANYPDVLGVAPPTPIPLCCWF